MHLLATFGCISKEGERVVVVVVGGRRFCQWSQHALGWMDLDGFGWIWMGETDPEIYEILHEILET